MRPHARIRAPAKVNLVLQVLGRRADGYHELRTLFQAVDLTDEVRVTRSAHRGVTLTVESEEDLGPRTRNLAYRAAAAFLAHLTPDTGVHVELVKRIPAGAGLGGGSSDAAAVLRCLQAMVPGVVEPDRLQRIGASLGSDVPFFLGRSALASATGRGEVLVPLDPLPPGDFVLVLPPVRVPTVEAYGALARARARTGPLPDEEFRLEESWRREAPSTWAEMARALQNDFEAVVVPSRPEIARSLRALEAAGATGVLLSGSGSAAFGVYPGRASAEHAARALADELGWRTEAVRSLTRLPEPEVEGL